MRCPRLVPILALACVLAAPSQAAAPLGDVSGDGAVSVRDAVLRLVRAAEPAYAPELDCNRDGTLSGGDVACIVNRALAKPSSYALPVNEHDPGVVLATSPEGVRVEFQGPKASDGRAQGIGDVIVTQASGAVFVIRLDASALPERIVTPDGTLFTFRWTWPTSVDAHVATASGVEADTTSALTLGASAAAIHQAVDPPGAGTVTLTVTDCGHPADGAGTWLNVTRASGDSLSVAGRSTGAGTYAFTLPTSESVASAGAQATCETAAEWLDYACTALQAAGPQGQAAACPALAAAVSAVATPAAGAAVFAACVAGLGGLQFACDTIGFSAPGGSSLLAESCAHVGESIDIIDRHLEGDVTLRASAVVAGHGARSTAAQSAPAAGPFPGFALAFDDCREECGNHADDDGDTLVDCADPDCAATSACAETNCGNGLDDDADGWADCQDDDCTQSTSCREFACADGIDNEEDGLIDCADLDCIEAAGCREDACDNGLDDDHDGLTDCADPNCLTLPACDNGEICDNGVDDDHDAAVDCADTECVLDPACGGPLLEDCDNGVDDNADGDVDCDDVLCWFEPACAFEWLCDDGVDDDLDGLTDCADGDCTGDPACAPPAESCFNGIDDDHDGLTDCADTECSSLPACTPSEICDNGIDDNHDGHVDCADIACAGTASCGEHACANGQDDDHDGLTDCADPDCACGENCTNGIDDNGNGAVDCADLACAGGPQCTAVENCSNGTDDDGDELVDCADDSCAGDPACQQQLYCACFFDTSPPNVNDWWWHCWQTTNPDGWPGNYIVSPGECQCGPEIYTICH